MVVEVPCMDQRKLKKKKNVNLVITILIMQKLIEVVAINMHLMFTLNHPSEPCLSQWHFSHYYAGFTRYDFWKSFLFLFWICITHFPASSLATMPNSREGERQGTAVRAQDSAAADKTSGFTPQHWASHCFQSVWVHCTSPQLQDQQNQGSLRLVTHCNEPDHWHPGEGFQSIK